MYIVHVRHAGNIQCSAVEPLIVDPPKLRHLLSFQCPNNQFHYVVLMRCQVHVLL